MIFLLFTFLYIVHNRLVNNMLIHLCGGHGRPVLMLWHALICRLDFEDGSREGNYTHGLQGICVDRFCFNCASSNMDSYTALGILRKVSFLVLTVMDMDALSQMEEDTKEVMLITQADSKTYQEADKLFGQFSTTKHLMMYLTFSYEIQVTARFIFFILMQVFCCGCKDKDERVDNVFDDVHIISNGYEKKLLVEKNASWREDQNIQNPRHNMKHYIY